MNDEGLRLSCSEFFKDLLSKMYDRMQGSPLKFVIYSGHETTMLGLLPCLGYMIDYIPYYGSTILFELYEDSSVKIYYND